MCAGIYHFPFHSNSFHIKIQTQMQYLMNLFFQFKTIWCVAHWPRNIYQISVLQITIPALKWGQSWNMTGLFKMCATTDAAITQAVCFHFLLEDCVSSAKSLMPLTTTHSVLKSWAAAYTPGKKKHSCLLAMY